MAITGKTKGSELHHHGEFLHNYGTFESVHDSDHDGVVRIFISLSCELGAYYINPSHLPPIPPSYSANKYHQVRSACVAIVC